jgi:4-carboxymuconolactone decarboxylase
MRELAELNEALDARRAVLGDEYVNRALRDDSQGAQDFQAFATATAWELWTREGLSLRERSILTLGISAALGWMGEFSVHLAGARRNGMTEQTLDEVVLHIGAYAGVPAAVAARKALTESRLV